MMLRRLAPFPAEKEPTALLAEIGPCLAPFAAETLEFGRRLSQRLLAAPEVRTYPDLASLGFWLRPAATQALRRHLDGLAGDGVRRLPRGLALHIAPANVETLFVYSWWLSALCGNANLVRISERSGERTRLLLRLFNQLLAEPGFAPLAAEGYGAWGATAYLATLATGAAKTWQRDVSASRKK